MELGVVVERVLSGFVAVLFRVERCCSPVDFLVHCTCGCELPTRNCVVSLLSATRDHVECACKEDP